MVKVKDLASCFYSCRFPMEDEPDILKESPPQNPAGEGGVKKGRGNIGKRRCIEPSLAEEDYIVFCFRDDGAIDVIKEGGGVGWSEESGDDYAAVSSSKVEIRLHCDECLRPSSDSNAVHPTQPSQIKDENWRISNEVDNENESKIEFFESSDSNTSDTSTSSFAFPVLGPEWIGSPDNMPRRDDRTATP